VARRAELSFGEAYLQTWARTFEDYGEPHALIAPENGPASRELYGILRRVLREGERRWVSRTPRVWFGAFQGDPEALLRELFLRPNPEYRRFILETVDFELDPAAGEVLLAAVARECGRGGWRGLASSLSLGVSSRLGGASLFLQAFTAARHHGAYDPDRPFRLVRRENGPATRQLYEALALYGEAAGDFDRDSAVQILENPPEDPYNLILTAVAWLYGSAAADRLLRDVALEAFRSYPSSGPLLAWDSFVMLAAGPSEVHYTAGKRGTDLPGPLYLSSGIDQLPEGLRREVSGEEPPTPVFDALYRGAHLLRPLILVSCLVLLPFAWAGPARSLVALLLLLAFSQYAIVAVMSQPHGRFSDQVYLLIVMAVGIGAAGARHAASSAEGRGR
jgi:hypothetical protein